MSKLRKRIVATIAIMSTLLIPGQIFSETSVQFNQGSQYEQGTYDSTTEQPTIYNWNRNSQYKSIDRNPYIKWKFSPIDTYFRSPVVIGKDGTVYAGAYNKPLFYALNSDGTEKWSYSGKSGEYFRYDAAPAIAADGTIYVGSSYGLHAINPDGSRKWYIDFNGRTNGVSLDSDGNIYVLHANTLYSLDATGVVKWSKTLYSSQSVSSVPSISKDGNIYVAEASGIEAFNKQGSRLWLFSVGAYEGYGSPTIGEDGTIYLGLGNGTQIGYMYAINPDGTQKWKLTVESKIDAPPTVDKEGTLYFGLTYAKKFYAVNPDGTVKWSISTPNFYMNTGPILDSISNIYFTSASNWDTTLHAITSSGANLWDITITGTQYGANVPPAIAKDGTIYIASGQGIIAIGGEIDQPFDFCQIFNSLKQKVDSGLSTPEEITQARSEVDILKAKIQELENKVIEAENKN
ncbi:outer membrane protein assembly factor BamB family protein [Paenibacillus durus]|uniref:Pyrrolo-quinoline quinone repeat domain-containing protein n=1 Tax=Paenibacillus durus TaxID=44251 RepID=A0A089HT13_PAEDU|nr:PQQ-binding-like beta-propeller repeat protein [Paenibacillus durus]AIQ13870.1 hypothetical protein PDUR_19630 [Paenibacillus durus]